MFITSYIKCLESNTVSQFKYGYLVTVMRKNETKLCWTDTDIAQLRPALDQITLNSTL